MRHSHQSLFGDEFAGFATDAVGLVLYSHQSCFEVLNKLHLSLRQSSALFLIEGVSPFFKHFKGGRGVGGVVAVGICQLIFKEFVVFVSFVKFGKD